MKLKDWLIDQADGPPACEIGLFPAVVEQSPVQDCRNELPRREGDTDHANS